MRLLRRSGSSCTRSGADASVRSTNGGSQVDLGNDGSCVRRLLDGTGDLLEAGNKSVSRKEAKCGAEWDVRCLAQSRRCTLVLGCTRVTGEPNTLTVSTCYSLRVACRWYSLGKLRSDRQYMGELHLSRAAEFWVGCLLQGCVRERIVIEECVVDIVVNGRCYGKRKWKGRGRAPRYLIPVRPEANSISCQLAVSSQPNNGVQVAFDSHVLDCCVSAN